MSPVDNYEKRVFNLVSVIKKTKDRLDLPNFKGVLLYNCGIPESEDIAKKVVKRKR